jgi:hypothetical protein
MQAITQDGQGESENVLRLSQAGPRSATVMSCWACMPPASTGAAGISWQASPIRSAWRAPGSGRPGLPYAAGDRRTDRGRRREWTARAVDDEVFGLAKEWRGICLINYRLMPGRR